MKLLNIAAYKFMALDNLTALRTTLKSQTLKDNLRGTILLSPEGINLMLTGLLQNIQNFKIFLAEDARFADLHYKESAAETQTYHRMLVKIKKEIIAFGLETIVPVSHSTPYIKATQLKQWLDEKREFVFLDARNQYEIGAGTFKTATHLNIDHFRQFPEAVKNLDHSLKDKTIVTFCTGGIRCEKAALLLQDYGFKNVYQLEGGILEYFAQCGDAHYQGECYVFDQRMRINAQAVYPPYLKKAARKKGISLNAH